MWPPRGAATAVEVAAREVPGAEVSRAAESGAPAVANAASSARGAPSSFVSEIERVWLGRTRGPLAERLAEAGWSADEATAYCPRCASSAGPYDADDTGCGWCRGNGLAWERAVRLGDYAGVLRDVVLEVKFTRWRRLGDRLGRMLGRALGEALDDAGVERERAVLVPVPMSLRRWLVAGIDHAMVIARGVAAEAGVPVARALRRRHGPSQVQVSRRQRFRNVQGAFAARERAVEGLRDRVFVVVDDVRTTGATMTGACLALRKAGASRVWSAVLGVTPERAGPA